MIDQNTLSERYSENVLTSLLILSAGTGGCSGFKCTERGDVESSCASGRGCGFGGFEFLLSFCFVFVFDSMGLVVIGRAKAVIGRRRRRRKSSLGSVYIILVVLRPAQGGPRLMI